MYTTPHAKLRFMERVENSGVTKKHKDKFIENYIKKAYKHGLTPNEIDDVYLRNYMLKKLHRHNHYLTATKITHYKNNLFLFREKQCITILKIPKNAIESVDNIIYITKLNSFINAIKERKCVKEWLQKYAIELKNNRDIKRCVVKFPSNLDYTYIMNYFPSQAIKYIKNDDKLRKIIKKLHKQRKNKFKRKYELFYALLLLIPKNQILKLQQALQNNKQSIFYFVYVNGISKKQLDLAYKQLMIMQGGEIKPKYNDLDINNIDVNSFNKELYGALNNAINNVKEIFKRK